MVTLPTPEEMEWPGGSGLGFRFRDPRSLILNVNMYVHTPQVHFDAHVCVHSFIDVQLYGIRSEFQEMILHPFPKP